MNFSFAYKLGEFIEGSIFFNYAIVNYVFYGFGKHWVLMLEFFVV